MINFKDKSFIYDLCNVVYKKIKILPYIIEKDFWVATILDWIFNKSEFKDYFIFKGGTSLSKAFNIIQRFSEDIDLCLDYERIGITRTIFNRPQNQNQVKKLIKEINLKQEKILVNIFLPALTSYLKKLTGQTPKINYESSRGFFRINYYYQKTFVGESTINQILIEITCLGNFHYSTKSNIQSIVCQCFPKIFTNQNIPVIAVPWLQTFWDKITILQAKSHSETVLQRYSRHWFYVFKILESKEREKTILDSIGVFFNTINFKIKYFYIANAKYEDILNGNASIIPNGKLGQLLKEDYIKMSEMIYGDKPTWKTIITKLKKFQLKLNNTIKKFLQDKKINFYSWNNFLLLKIWIKSQLSYMYSK